MSLDLSQNVHYTDNEVVVNIFNSAFSEFRFDICNFDHQINFN